MTEDRDAAKLFLTSERRAVFDRIHLELAEVGKRWDTESDWGTALPSVTWDLSKEGLRRGGPAIRPERTY